MSPSPVHTFQEHLARRRRRWVWGLQLAAAFHLTAGFLAGWVILAAFDALLALPASARAVLAIGWSALYAGALAVSWVRCRRYRDADFSRYADRLAGRRRPILSSLQSAEELSRESVSPFKRYLSESLLRDGIRALEAHPEKNLSDNPALQRGRRVFLATGAVALLASVALWSIATVVYPRVFFPWRDNPPFSPYTFTVHLPEEPVYYGDTAELAVDVAGPELRHPVLLRMRGPGGESERMSFQESDRRFVQQVENLTDEIEISFASGRARTRWMAVPLRYEPRILAARLRTAPPAYTGIPATDSVLREDEIGGFAGTEVTLSVASNRPLGSGTLRLTDDDEDVIRTVNAEIQRGSSARFRWILEEDATLEVVLEDLRGTQNREPFTLTQSVIEDEPPEIALTEPPAYSLATPSITLSLEGYARDDLGLERVNLWRGLGRFRDRARHLGPDRPAKNLGIGKELALAQIGAEPGDVLEFYLQASDRNPDGAPVTSNLLRVEIIDEEEYAELLRREVTIRDFIRRMEETYIAIESVTEAIEALQEAVESGADDAETEALREALAEAIREAGNSLDTLAGDFPVFDVESRAAAVWRETADALAAQGEALRDMDLSAEDAAGNLAAMKERWSGPESDDLASLYEESEILSQVQDLMQLANDLAVLVGDQNDLVRHMDREVNRPEGVDPDTIQQLGSSQESIRERLERIARDVQEKAESLPDSPEFSGLRESAMEVMTLIYAMEIPPDMEDAAEAGGNVRADEMFTHANRALEKLEELLADCSDSAFGGMCQGDLNFSIPNLDQTLAQMLGSLLGPPSPGGGAPGGGGFGVGGGRGAGMGAEGGWMSGYASPLGVPVYGPQRSGYSPSRTGFASRQNGTRGAGNGGGPGSGGASRIEGSGPVEAEAADREPRDSFPLHQLPARYRGAAERYFRIIEE